MAARGGQLAPQIRGLFETLMAADYGIDIQSHWMAYAACEAFERRLIDPDLVGPYIARLIRGINRRSAYRKRNQSTPIACRSEALLRFLRVERKAVFLGHAFSPELVQTARRTVEENLDLQRRWYENGQFWKGD